jgi:hypothetical protein
MSLLCLLQPPISVMNPARMSPRELRAGVSLAAAFGTRPPVAGHGWTPAGPVISTAGFDVVQARLPALVSRAAPRRATGAARAVHSSVQFPGTIFGAATGGAIAWNRG